MEQKMEEIVRRKRRTVIIKRIVFTRFISFILI